MFGLVLKTVISGLQNDCSLDCVKKKYKQKIFTAAAAAKSLQLCPTLCNPIDGSPPGSSVLGTLQARTLEWVAISFCNACMHAKSLQLYPTLCDPIDSSPAGSSVHRILQARTLEWAALSLTQHGFIVNVMAPLVVTHVLSFKPIFLQTYFPSQYFSSLR